MNVNRLIFKELCDDLERPEITILLGARQVGKTYLLKQLESYARAKGKKTAYFNLEIPSDILKFRGSEEDIFKLLSQSGDVIFLDEFHYLKNASHLFKAVYDSQSGVKIFASGSSSLEIHKHLKESLAGRRILRQIYPLSVKEFKENSMDMDEILIEGTLPGLLHIKKSHEKQLYLQDLIETYILKDIKSLIKEENVKAFNHLLFFLAEHQGSVIAVANLAREVGLTCRTIEKYLTILEQTYVCYSCQSFSTNLSNELKKSRKYFFYDLGIRNAIVKNFEYDLNQRSDKGILYESLIFIELLKKVSPTTSLCFWRTKQKEEVDFVKVVNRKPIPIEVKSKLKSMIIPDGMIAFLKKYPKVQVGYVINEALTGEVRYQGAVIRFLKWQYVDQI